MTAVGDARVFVGIGANLGDARRSVESAIDSISDLPGVLLVGRSSLYRSAPIDAQGPEFVNAVVELRTALSPHELLTQLQRIEASAGRERSHRNAPRTLDLDVLLWGDTTLETADLTLPHPRLHQRAFVLRPLLEVAPDLQLPGLGAARDWLVVVDDQDATVLE